LAVKLNSKVIDVHGHFEESVLSPVGSPGVSSDPVLLFRVFVVAVSDNRDFVIEFNVIKVLGVDASSVILLKVISCLDSAADWSIQVEFLLHVVGT